jgi:putative intracellular protease/amidase
MSLPRTVLILLPERDFDPSEAAVPWQMLSALGHRVLFATPEGKAAEADPRMLDGRGLDLWGFIPGLGRLKLLGLMLRADARTRSAYARMQREPVFRYPLPYSSVRIDDIDGLILPGGHWARGMRAYLEDERVHALIAQSFAADKAVAAVCHGVVAVARSRSKETGRSVLYGRKTTALTWSLERSAWSLMRWCGRVWDADYYRTYREETGEPEGYRSVEAEIKRALASPDDFLDVGPDTPHRFIKGSGLFRDRVDDERPAFVVVDGRYVSARWPGDVHTLSKRFHEVLQSVAPRLHT